VIFTNNYNTFRYIHIFQYIIIIFVLTFVKVKKLWIKRNLVLLHFIVTLKLFWEFFNTILLLNNFFRNKFCDILLFKPFF